MSAITFHASAEVSTFAALIGQNVKAEAKVANLRDAMARRVGFDLNAAGATLENVNKLAKDGTTKYREEVSAKLKDNESALNTTKVRASEGKRLYVAALNGNEDVRAFYRKDDGHKSVTELLKDLAEPKEAKTAMEVWLDLTTKLAEEGYVAEMAEVLATMADSIAPVGA